MKDPLGVSPSKGNQGTIGGKEKLILTSVGIEPTTSGLDLPLFCRLSYTRSDRESRGCPTSWLSRQSNGRSNPEVVGSTPTKVKEFFLYLVWFPSRHRFATLNLAARFASLPVYLESHEVD